MSAERMRELLKAATYKHAFADMPDIACKRCGREIYCGNLEKLCGKDCYKLQERDAKSNNLK